MAPLGPLPEIVSKLISRAGCVARRKPSSRRTASISSISPGGCASSQARKRTIAAPSRTCAARAPLISADVFTALSAREGSGPRAMRPGPPSARANQEPAVFGSRRTRFLALRRALMRSERASGGESLANASRCARAACVDLLRCDEELGLARLRDDRERERNGDVRNVGAADVERPRDGIAQGEDDRVMPVGLEPRLDVGDFVLRRPSRELQRLHADRAHGRAPGARAPTGGRRDCAQRGAA